MTMSSFVLTVICPAKRGIIAAISTFLAKNACNIVNSSQFDDPISKKFFCRIGFDSEGGKAIHDLEDAFCPIAQEFSMKANFFDTRDHMKVLVMVSKFGHCLNDLLYRWRIGALPIDIVGVVSNHLDYQKLVVNNDLPFYHIPVHKDRKQESEDRLFEIISETGTELVVLARYMQILSDRLCKEMPGQIINIHHSFLPSFKGANPYKQAFQRGVKIIGATAHYVTADLDEGPIIEQDIVRVTHAQNADDYVALGRDVEAQVLARAIHAHIHHRVFINDNRTVVFPATPGSYASKRMG